MRGLNSPAKKAKRNTGQAALIFLLFLAVFVPVVAFPRKANAVVVVSPRIYENEIIAVGVMHIATPITASMSFFKLIDIINISNNEEVQFTYLDIAELRLFRYQQTCRNIEVIVRDQNADGRILLTGGE